MPRFGIALRILTAALAAVLSVQVRAISGDVTTGEIVFWRSALALPVIVAYMALRREFPDALRTARPGLHLTRGVIGVCAMFLSFYSLSLLPVANQTALTLLAPILSLPVAALVLRERVSPAMVLGAALGLAGTVAMLWHAFETPAPGALRGVAAALGFATIMAGMRALVKSMTATERPSTIAFYFTVSGSLVGAVLAWGAPLPEGDVFLRLAAIGATGALVHIAATESLARAPVSVLAPFDYLIIVFALGLDVALFAKLPGALEWVGIAAISAGALIVTAASHGRLRIRLRRA